MEFAELEILDTTLTAACMASEDSEESHLTLDQISDRNEPWICSYLAIKLTVLARKQGDSEAVYVTLEARVSWMPTMTSTANAKIPSLLSPGRRFDLAVWNDDGICGLLEVKNAPGMDNIRFMDDLKKLDAALASFGSRARGTLRWAAYLFSVRLSRAQAEAGTSIKNLYERRLATAQNSREPKNIAYDFRASNRSKDCRTGWGVILLRP